MNHFFSFGFIPSPLDQNTLIFSIVRGSPGANLAILALGSLLIDLCVSWIMLFSFPQTTLWLLLSGRSQAHMHNILYPQRWVCDPRIVVGHVSAKLVFTFHFTCCYYYCGASPPFLITHHQDLHCFWQCPLGRSISSFVLNKVSPFMQRCWTFPSYCMLSPWEEPLCHTTGVGGWKWHASGATPLLSEWMLRRWLPHILLACLPGMEALPYEPAWVKAIGV